METTVRLDPLQFWTLWVLFAGIICGFFYLSKCVEEQTDYFKEQDKIDRMGE